MLLSSVCEFMYKVHGFLDDKKVLHQQMAHLPRAGDTVRLNETICGIVKEVVWCMDEPEFSRIEGQRINLRMETLK